MGVNEKIRNQRVMSMSLSFHLCLRPTTNNKWMGVDKVIWDQWVCKI